ncbi:MAG TPA: hypothetical protein VJT82_06010, partial [Pyrinomonadaceae bacterium]|nr:hypothetical protein [Pyrinomonadaceae bacterium]
MSEKMKNQNSPHAHDLDPHAARRDESHFAASDEELKSLLESWQSPLVPASLDARVFNSYRELFSRQKEEVMNLHPTDNLTPQYALPTGSPRGEYRLTILEERGLASRLLAELGETARDAELTRAEFRRDPFGFVRRMAAAYGAMTWRALRQENTAYGVVTAFVVVLTLVGAVVAVDRYKRAHEGLLAERVREDLVYLGGVTEIPKVQPEPDKTGAGMAKEGNGGGSKPEQERPGGGGGGGRHEALPASNGKLPQATLLPQLLAPNPKPPDIKNPSLPTPATIQADPVLFPTDTSALNYGDPKSKSTQLSSGSGDGNGIGDGNGGGVGSGNGTGYRPGEGYNTGGGPAHVGGGGPGKGGGMDYDRTFKTSEVTRKAQIISKPEPLYTEEARKNQVTGTVRLRLVLGASGSISGI